MGPTPGKLGCVLTLLLVASLAQSPGAVPTSSGHDSAPERRLIHPLRVNWTVDGTVTGVGLVAWLASEAVFKHQLAPADCRWCDRDSSGADTLNAFDRWGRTARWGADDLLVADGLSNAAAFVVLPAALLGTHGWIAASNENFRHLHEDMLIIAEAVVLASVVNQGTKFVVGRARPFVHALPLEERPLTARPHDNNLSFYSGHASFAFSMLAASLTVAELRDYRHRWALWAVGLPLAISVPYFRMAADRHYLSDVVVGTVIGAAFGVGVPLLFHGRVPANVRVSAGPSGIALAGTFD